jgi:hypothetical protein
MTGYGLAAAALRYAASGWPVFPCTPDGTPAPDHKAPLTCHGFKDATTDPARIRAWWRRWPDANIGIATGAPAPDVLDVDRHEDGDGFAALGRLKRAGLLTGASRLVRTPSGGAHVYFAGTGQGCHALPRHHLDFKSGGGYVLAPPSMVHGKRYELLDHRESTAALNWQAVKRLLEPPRPPMAAPAPWKGAGLPPIVQRALAAPAEDRSKALHRLVGACVRAGLDEARIHQLAAGYPPALEKYGPRLPAEVERSLSRIGAR